MESMVVKLPDGLYPFIDQRIPLRELVMVEAPHELEMLLRNQAAENGIEIVRDEPVELRCASEQFPEDATFLVYWPSGEERMHMLVPIGNAKGRA